jgi:hypothetical protein
VEISEPDRYFRFRQSGGCRWTRGWHRDGSGGGDNAAVLRDAGLGERQPRDLRNPIWRQCCIFFCNCHWRSDRFAVRVCPCRTFSPKSNTYKKAGA